MLTWGIWGHIDRYSKSMICAFTDTIDCTIEGDRNAPICNLNSVANFSSIGKSNRCEHSHSNDNDVDKANCHCRLSHCVIIAPLTSMTATTIATTTVKATAIAT